MKLMWFVRRARRSGLAMAVVLSLVTCVYPPMAVVKASAPVGSVTINGGAGTTGGWTYSPGGFTRASEAYNPVSGTQVGSGQPRVVMTQPSGRHGVVIEHNTRNLLSANQSSVESDLAGLAAWGPTSGPTITRDTTVAWTGSASARAVATANGNVAIYTGHAKTPVTPNATYTFSVNARAQAAAGRQWHLVIFWFDAGGQFIYGSYSADTTASSQWTRVSVTATAPANAQRGYVDLSLLNAVTGETLWWDGAQLEEWPYATTWIPGNSSRENEYLSLLTAGTVSAMEGTIEGWFQLNDTSTTHYGPVFTTGGHYPTPRLLIMRELEGPATGRLKVWDGDGSSETSYAGTTVLQPGVWYHYAFVWSPAGRKLYVNGAEEATSSRSVPLGIDSTAFVGGSGAQSGAHANGLFGNVRISSRARTDAEIAAGYSSGVFDRDQDTTAMVVPQDVVVGSRRAATPGQAVTVRLDLQAQDGGAGITQMRLSNDGATWSAWQPYATPVLHTLPTGDGPQTVYAQFQNSTGDTSPTYSASVIAATAAPMGTLAPTPGSTAGPGETLSLTVHSQQAVSWSGPEWKPLGASTWQADSPLPGGTAVPGSPFTVNWPVPTTPGAYQLRVKLTSSGGTEGYAETILTLPSAPDVRVGGGHQADMKIFWTTGGGTAFSVERATDEVFPTALTDKLAAQTQELAWVDAFNGASNGSFEAGLDATGAPAGWNWYGTGTHAVDPTTAKWGSSALKFSRTASGDDEAVQTVFSGPGLGGRPVTVSGWIKTQAVTGTGALLKLQYLDRSGAVLGTSATIPVTGTSDWQRVTTTGWAPPGTWQVELLISLSQATGTVWADGIQLEPSMVASATFSPGPAGGQRYYYRVTAWNGPLHSHPGLAGSAETQGLPEQTGMWRQAMR